MTSTTTTIEAGPVSIRHNLPELEALFTRAPSVAAYYVRDLIGRWFGSHHRTWRKGLKPWQKRLQARGAYLYRVLPTVSRAQGTTAKAFAAGMLGQSLEAIVGRGVIRSAVVYLHETGGTVRPTRGQYLAVPVGRFRKLPAPVRRQLNLESPADWNQANPGNPLFPLTRRGAPVLVRKTGKQTARGKDQLETVFLLKRSVTVPASLGVLRTWNAQEFDRAVRQKQATDAIVAALAGMTKGVTSAAG